LLLLQGIDGADAAYFISIIGVTSTVGRVGFGLISDRPWVNSVLVYNFCVLVMGVSTFLLPFCFNYYLIAFMYTCFGTALSGFIALSSIILVELLGLENLTNAFGLLIFFRGISSVLGTPLSG
jgi:predicted MFS family arabinose efflux permease